VARGNWGPQSKSFLCRIRLHSYQPRGLLNWDGHYVVGKECRREDCHKFIASADRMSHSEKLNRKSR